MSNKLYVGNLSFQTKNEELESAFGQYGQVSSVRIITDRDTGRSKGFAFVEMSSNDEAQKCIENLDGKDLGGRSGRVNIAQEQEKRPARSPQGNNNRRW